MNDESKKESENHEPKFRFAFEYCNNWSVVLSIFLISTSLLVWLAISPENEIFAFCIYGVFVVYVFLLIIWLYKTIKHFVATLRQEEEKYNADEKKS